MTKKLTLTIISVLVVGVGTQTFAFGGGFPGADGCMQKGSQGGPMFMEDNVGPGGLGQGCNQGKQGKGARMMKEIADGSTLEAVKANDYDAFVKARNDSKKLMPTQDEFTKMVEREIARNALDKALLANDYDAFKIAFANQPKPTGTGVKTLPTPPLPTQEQFTKKVEIRKAHYAVELAIQNNDYAAFKAAIANLPKPIQGGKNGKAFVVPSQEEFAKMVERHQQRTLVNNALLSNNYSAFAAAWTANQPTVPTKEEFAKMVEKYTNMTAKGGKKGFLKNILKKATRS